MKIRINQDVTFNWKLTVEGESVDLSKLELSVEITTPSNKKTEITPTIKFDTLEFNYRPKQVGEYILSAYLNRFKDGETALDIKAFEGVKYTWNQDFSTDDNLAANYVELAGDLNYGYKLDINKVTYTDLVNLKNNAQLTSGRFYQITDYVTTTTQEGTKSAGHPFDVIVLALSENELSERAWAIQHEGDEYFANSDLNAWQIWYCLDNDTTRFAWADSINGKGVIYRMIDEFNNDIPYDFKNIQFKHPNDTTTYPHFYYTFASRNVEDNTDGSLSIKYGCYSNTIKEYIDDRDKRRLNCIIFISLYCNSNSFDYDCYNNTFGQLCSNNTFGSCCYNNSFGSSCYNNSFGNNCYNNSFYGGNTKNTLGLKCFNNRFGGSSGGNTLGSDCCNNFFGAECFNNSIGNSCNNIKLWRECSSNYFGNNCNNVEIGNNCSNTSFGNGCRYVKFAGTSSSITTYAYYQNNHFGVGCKYIYFSGAETASEESQVQNYNFAQGLQGASNAFLSIDGKRGRAYETKVAKNSNGELKIYCEADSIQ